MKKQRSGDSSQQLGRRAFLNDGVLHLAAVASATHLLPSKLLAAEEQHVRFGLVTDMHYADKPPAGQRHYRDALSKISEVAEKFADSKPAFVVELGDLIDAASSVEVELKYLKRIQVEFVKLSAERHYVLGNHCVDTLTKREFLDEVEQEKSFYSFDRGRWHFVVLDACFNSSGQPYQRKNFVWNDANIPDSEIEWLREDLKSSDKYTAVLAHQRLDETANHSVKNCKAVRRVLEESKNVRAVFQGHSHQNDYQEISGIHYCTLVAVVEGASPENNGYSIVDLASDGTIRLTGFRKQASRNW